MVGFVTGADTIRGVAAGVAGLFLLTVSSGLVEWVTLPVLRLVEGYWLWPFKGLRFWLAAQLGRRLERQKRRWQTLSKEYEAGKLGARSMEEYARLDAELVASYPETSRLLPTRLGNVLPRRRRTPRTCPTAWRCPWSGRAYGWCSRTAPETNFRRLAKHSMSAREC